MPAARDAHAEVDVDARGVEALVLEDRHAPFASPWHAHRRHQVLYAVEGAYLFEVEDRQWLLPPERAAWIPGAVRHRVRCARPVRLVALYAEDAFARAHAPSLPVAPCVFSLPAIGRELLVALAAAARAAPLAVRRADADAFPSALVGAALGVVARAAASERPFHLPRPRTKELAAALDALLGALDEPPSLADTARAAGMSARTFDRRMRAELAVGYRGWLARARMLRAMELLAVPGARVTEAAFAVGFETPSSFATAFLRFTGETPTAYRRRVGGA